MKRIAKDIWLQSLDKHNPFVLSRRWHTADKDGNLVEKDGELQLSESRIGYYSEFNRMWSKIVDLGYVEFINSDLSTCKHFMDEATKNIKEYIDETR